MRKPCDAKFCFYSIVPRQRCTFETSRYKHKFYVLFLKKRRKKFWVILIVTNRLEIRKSISRLLKPHQPSSMIPSSSLLERWRTWQAVNHPCRRTSCLRAKIIYFIIIFQKKSQKTVKVSAIVRFRLTYTLAIIAWNVTGLETNQHVEVVNAHGVDNRVQLHDLKLIINYLDLKILSSFPSHCYDLIYSFSYCFYPSF